MLCSELKCDWLVCEQRRRRRALRENGDDDDDVFVYEGIIIDVSARPAMAWHARHARRSQVLSSNYTTLRRDRSLLGTGVLGTRSCIYCGVHVPPPSLSLSVSVWPLVAI